MKAIIKKYENSYEVTINHNNKAIYIGHTQSKNKTLALADVMSSFMHQIKTQYFMMGYNLIIDKDGFYRLIEHTIKSKLQKKDLNIHKRYMASQNDNYITEVKIGNKYYIIRHSISWLGIGVESFHIIITQNKKQVMLYIGNNQRSVAAKINKWDRNTTSIGINNE